MSWPRVVAWSSLTQWMKWRVTTECPASPHITVLLKERRAVVQLTSNPSEAVSNSCLTASDHTRILWNGGMMGSSLIWWILRVFLFVIENVTVTKMAGKHRVQPVTLDHVAMQYLRCGNKIIIAVISMWRLLIVLWTGLNLLNFI